MILLGYATPRVVRRAGRGGAGCPCALTATAVEVMRALGMDFSADLHARAAGEPWTADEWRRHMAEEEDKLFPKLRTVRAESRADLLAHVEALVIDHKLYRALLDAGKDLPRGDVPHSIDVHGQLEDWLVAKYANELLADVGGIAHVGESLFGSDAFGSVKETVKTPEGFLTTAIAPGAPVPPVRLSPTSAPGAWGGWLKNAAWWGVGLLGARWLGWGWGPALAVGGVTALAVDAVTGHESGSATMEPNAKVSPARTAEQRVRILKYWKAYREALAKQFKPGYVADGITDYAQSIDAARATIDKYIDNRNADYADFRSGVAKFFGETGAKWFDAIRNFAESLSTPGGYSWDKDRLEEAKACAVQTLAEGFPLIGYSVNMIATGDHMSFQGVRETYCAPLEAMRSLEHAEQEALKTLWRLTVANSQNADVAFALRYGLYGFIQDDYSAENDVAMHATGYYAEPKTGLELTYEDVGERTWAVAAAIVLSAAHHRPMDAEIDRVLSHVDDVQYRTGPDGTQTPTDVWRKRAYIAKVAVS